MRLNSEQISALCKLYPQITVIYDDKAYDANGNEVQYDLAEVNNQAALDQCKETASALLYDTDWTTIADVANPVNSPYLANQADFIIYRNQVRKLAVTPVADPVFPPKPDQVWK
jgi:hypothetical protein